MNVLSLFDGISCAMVAINRCNITIKEYFASEIDKNAIAISHKNYPNIKRLGCVKSIKTNLLPPIDLLIFGSPCQDLSIAKKGRKGLSGDRSGLFWDAVKILKEIKPKYFIMENVASMKISDRDIITKELGVKPILFDASLVSAQSRKRYFWTNIPFSLPEDKNILLKDILLPADQISDILWVKETRDIYIPEGQSTANIRVGRDIQRRINNKGIRADNDKTITPIRRIEVRDDDKCGTLTSVLKDNQIVNIKDKRIRKIDPIECERLQGLPDNYTSGISYTHRYKALGNAFNVDVITHILKQIC